MKKNLVRRMGLVGLAGGLLVGLAGCPFDVVFISDKALESAIRASIGKPMGLLPAGDLLGVTELQASDPNIRSLDGLEYCLNLTVVKLRNNQMQSILPLAGLANLTWVDLGENRITNIEPLSGLFFLQYLDLCGDDNDIRVFTPLVANALAGGIGAGTTLTLSPEWTLQSDGTFYADFEDDYLALVGAGVTIIFAESSGT